MSRKFDVNAGLVGNPKLTLVRFTLVAVTSVVGATLTNNGTARAESSLPVSGDDPLAWLERPVDCGLTNDAVNARYGAILKGGTKNSLLSEEFKFVSSETCSGKRFSSCQFSWCKPLGEQAAEKPVAESITGKVEQFAKVQAEEKSRGWEFEGDDEEELAAEDLRGQVAKNDAPAANLVAAATDSSSRGSLAIPAVNDSAFEEELLEAPEIKNSFVPPKLVLGKNSIPTLPNGAVVKGVKRVNGSFLPVTYEVPEKDVAVSAAVVEAAPATESGNSIANNAVAGKAPGSSLSLVRTAEAAVVDAPAKLSATEPKVTTPIVLEPAPAAAVAPIENRIVSLVDSNEVALRTAAERELINLEKKLRERNDGRISVRVSDEDKKKIAWKVIEVPGASVRATFGGAKSSEATSIQGANTAEYARTIVPGIGRAPANNVVTGQEATLSRFNIATPQADRFKHAGPAMPGALTPTSNLPSQGTLPGAGSAVAGAGAAAAQPKMDIGVSVPVEDGYVSPIQQMKALKASALRH